MIVFDLDGTLLDSMGDFCEVAAKVMELHFGTEPSIAKRGYIQTSGLPFYYQLKTLYPEEAEAKVVSAADDFEEKKLAGYFSKSFYDDVLPCLKVLKEGGVLLCLSSNNHQENVQKKLEPISEYFDEILGFKPGFLKGKAHFDYLKNKYSLSSDEILFIGDSLSDAKKAKENGLDFLARLGTFKKDDFLKLNFPVQSILSLYDLVKTFGVA